MSVAIGTLAGNYLYNVARFGIADELVNNPFQALSRTVSDIAKFKGPMLEYAGAGTAGYGTYQVISSSIGETSTEAVAATEATETSTIIGTIMECLEVLPLLIIQLPPYVFVSVPIAGFVQLNKSEYILS